MGILTIRYPGDVRVGACQIEKIAEIIDASLRVNADNLEFRPLEGMVQVSGPLSELGDRQIQEIESDVADVLGLPAEEIEVRS